MRQQFILAHPTARAGAIVAVRNAPDGMVVEIRDKKRSLEQNAAQWPYLQAFSEQMEWPVNGAMCKLEPEEWKDILTAAFEGDTNPRLAAGWDGGVVMLGRRTREYGKKRFGEWLDWLKAAAALKDVTPRNYDADC